MQLNQQNVSYLYQDETREKAVRKNRRCLRKKTAEADIIPPENQRELYFEVKWRAFPAVSSLKFVSVCVQNATANAEGITYRPSDPTQAPLKGAKTLFILLK